jgi:nucleoside-diphosphate-sugar epimerase
MPIQSTVTPFQVRDIRSDCVASCANGVDVRSKLTLTNIAVTGGTGYLGTWLAEMIAALNDEFNAGINLHIYARNISEWKVKYQHLSSRSDVKIFTQDVRSPFNFEPQITHVIHAAGVPNNRIHSSNPLRVYQTTVNGAANVLEAASQLNGLVRFLNVSSGLVNGFGADLGGISEGFTSKISTGQLHNIYIDAKRSAESLAAIYRGQFKMPISTVRPFTFAGPYQSLDCPWAINNFLSDAIANRPIRINGDGSVRRSYLYGSDAAFWVLAALIKGVDGGVYNIGSANFISHKDLATLIASRSQKNNDILVNTLDINPRSNADFYPDLSNTNRELHVAETFNLEQIIEKTLRWFTRVEI